MDGKLDHFSFVERKGIVCSEINKVEFIQIEISQVMADMEN